MISKLHKRFLRSPRVQSEQMVFMRVISVLVIAALLAATPLAAFPAQAVGQAANPSQSGATLPNSTQVNGSDNLVVNGDFEQPVQLPGSEVYLDALPGWSFLMGTKVEIDNIPQQAHSGAQFLELDLNTARSIYQDLPTQPGMHYLLRFAYSPRPQRSAENNVLQVQWNGNQVGKLISADGSALTVPVWTVYQYILQATNATTRLQFTSPGTAPAPGFTLDSVSLIPLGGNNNSWTRAQEIVLSPDLVTPQVNSGSAIEYLFENGSSDWFKFKVTPGSRAVIQLTNLPANYDLTLYKDIPTAYHTLTSPKDLARVGAEFAADAFSADAFSADAFSADAFSADAFSADAFSADAFSADAFSADAFSADAFSADAFSPDAFSADAFSADAFSADAFSPANFNPDAPNSFPPQAFTSAQVRSLIGISAFDGTSSEGISVNTWDNSGYFYIRVHGRNGSFSLDAPFHLSVLLSGGECALVSPVLPPSSLAATSGNYQTVILTDLARIPGTISEKSVLQKQLAAFAARPEVAGVVVDVAADPRVLAANRQADANPTCPYAKNLVAYAIKDIIGRYRTLNPLAYLVIVGNDNVIPFFRHPDQALLASEKNFIPPVRDGTASQASLKLGYFLSQDRYASAYDISAKAVSLPIPDLAIGRLVETATDITGMLDAYLQTSGGEAPRPTSSLVTGYDFLAKTAQAIQVQLEAGTNAQSDHLIAPRDLSPQDPNAWNADSLRRLLLGKRHDLIFLAGHFSASSALAADYSSRLLTSDLISSDVDLTNALVFSAGCHAGYNTVDAHDITGLTPEPDWPQAFARKHATLIAGTGYQYGDTDFTEYSERIYLEFSKQLLVGSGPVQIGKALVATKQAYLAAKPELGGIDTKALLEITLYGLPMLSVDMPAGRTAPTTEPSVVPAATPLGSNPGLTLGLSTADVTFKPSLTSHSVPMKDLEDGTVVTATYLSGISGIRTAPAEPVLPLEAYNVTVPGVVLRGVGFRGGSYHDQSGMLPLTGAATTEIRGVHAPFISSFLYPVKTWNVNYFDTLAANGPAATRLMILPAQVQSDPADPLKSILRQFSQMSFRLFYSGNTTTYPHSGSTPALSSPPSISSIQSDIGSSSVSFHIHVTGDPSAGIQQVWVTYTALNRPLAGSWQSLDLVQNPQDSTLWEGQLALNGTNPADVRFMVQAANGVGLVALATNQGTFYIPGVDPGAVGGQGQPTQIELQSPPASGAYGTHVPVHALLTSNGIPLNARIVIFRIGAQQRLAVTGSNGVAQLNFPLIGLPDKYPLTVSFTGGGGYQASSASSPFILSRQATRLTLTPQPGTAVYGKDTGLSAILKTVDGRPLGQRTILFTINDGAHTTAIAATTDYSGRASLGAVPLTVGSFTIAAYFNGEIQISGQTLTLDDPSYTSTTATGSLTILPGRGNTVYFPLTPAGWLKP